MRVKKASPIAEDGLAYIYAWRSGRSVNLHA